jgi:hypothetical protein
METFLFKSFIFNLNPVLNLKKKSQKIKYKAERKWIVSILSHSCRTSLDYRLCEKRFVYRQLLSIYDSKLSDHELKSLILKVIYQTCACKYALVDLIKRHYILIWLSSVLESLNNGVVVSGQVTDSAVVLFHRMMQIYIRIWSELSSTAAVAKTEGVSDEKSQSGESSTTPKQGPPLTFLNQMYMLTKALLSKMIVYHKRVVLVKEVADSNEGEEAKSLSKDATAANTASHVNRNLINDEFKDAYKRTLKQFFKTNKELVHLLAQYEFSLLK